MGDGKAFEVLERAIGIRGRHGTADDRLRVWAHLLAAHTYSNADRPSPGLPHAETAMRALEAAGDQSLLMVHANYALASCLGDLGRADEAEPRFLAAIRMCETQLGPDDPALASILADFGYFLALKRYDYDRSHEVMVRAQTIAERCMNHDTRLLEAVLNNRSTLEDRLGNVPAALDAAQRCYELTLRRVGPAHLEALRAQKAITNLLQDKVRDFRAVVEISETMSPGLDAALGPSNSFALNSRLVWINALAEIGDTTSAGRELTIARQILARQPELANQNTVFLLQITADLANARGHGAAARDSLRRAIEIEWAARGKTGGRRGILYDHWMRTLTSPADRAALEEAGLDITRLADSTSIRRTWVWQPLVASRAAAEARLGLRELAWQHALEAEERARTQMDYQVLTMAEPYLLQLTRRFEQPCDLLVALAGANREQELATAWDRLVHWRGLVRHEVARRRLPPAVSADTAMAAAHGRWIAAQRKLAQLVVSGAAHPDDPKTRALFETAQRTAELAEHRYHAAASAVIPSEDSLSLERVLAALQPSQALVAFANASIGPGRESLGVFVATGSDPRPRWIGLGSSAQITRDVNAWTSRLATPPSSGTASTAETACRRAGEKVRRRVWDPIARAVGSSREIFIVPAGAATEIPWRALPLPSSRGYLAQGPAVIHELDAERDLLPEPDRSSGILAVGAPDFDRTGMPDAVAALNESPRNQPAMRARTWPCGDSFSLAPLPGSLAEVESITSTWPAAAGRAQVLAGAEADEATFKRSAAGHAVLHIATHGIVASDPCAAVASGTRGVGGVAEIATSSPGARPHGMAKERAPATSSSLDREVWLALAGANRAPSEAPGADDGLLTTAEIVTLDLRGTDWVVLSACHSGVATTWGREGALGMRRAFRLAGARTVISSAWGVGDDSTREWMSKLYDARARGADAGSAVGDACRAVLESRRRDGRSTHPFYWAAFTASGR